MVAGVPEAGVLVAGVPETGVLVAGVPVSGVPVAGIPETGVRVAGVLVASLITDSPLGGLAGNGMLGVGVLEGNHFSFCAGVGMQG